VRGGVGISTAYFAGFARCRRAFGVDGATGIRVKTLGRDHLLPAGNKRRFVVVLALARRVRPSSVRSVSVGAIRMREGSTHTRDRPTSAFPLMSAKL
jgi:hypothetical protein